MNIKCNTKELAYNVQIANSAVAAKPVNTALGGLCLIAQGKYLEINAVDSNLNISTVMEVTVEEEGSVLVPARLLNALMKKLAGPETVLKALEEENILIIENEKSRSRLPLMEVSAFPPMLTTSKNSFLSLPGTVLKDLIQKSVYAVGTDETRYIFTGVQISLASGEISFVGTNTHRIAMKNKRLENETENHIAIIPARVLREIGKLVSDQEPPEIKIALDGKRVVFRTGTVQMTSNLIEGKFPDIKKVIPSSCSSTAKTARKDLLEALERIRLFTSGSENNIIKFCFAEGKLEVSSEQKELGSSMEELGCELQGEPIKIAFNSQYVIDCLKSMDSDNVFLKMNTALSPAVIQAEGEDDYICIVTPIRIVF